MSEMDRPSAPEGPFGRARRRLFPRDPGSSIPADPEPASVAVTVDRLVSARMDEAVEGIREAAASLMHEIAAEVWRTAGGDKREVQATVVEHLSRDQAIRGLIAHSDERFQALAVRTGRLEDTLQGLAEQTRDANESLTGAVRALETAIAQPALVEVGDLRERLAGVVRQISRALETITERDRIIVEAVSERVQENGRLVTEETARIAQAMEAYVQHGVAALGQLAGRVDVQLAEFQGRFEVRLGEQVRLLDEELQLLREQTGVESRDVRAILEANERHLREWTIGLARLVRADAETLRAEIVRTTAEQDESMARSLDERLARLTERTEATIRHLMEELAGRLHDNTSSGLDRINTDQRRMLQDRLDEAVGALDRNMVRMSDHLESQLDRLGTVVGQQAAQAASAVLSSRVDETLQLMRAGNEDIAKGVGERITALAKMVRSDNRALAERMRQVVEQDTARQALRAVKELQANLPDEVLRLMEIRLEALADRFHRDIQEANESIAKIGDAVDRKVDQMAARIGQRYGNDLQTVVERMGDAMHALGSLGRGTPPDRIDLD